MGAAAAAIGSDIYVLGGRTGKDFGDSSLNDLHVLDIHSGDDRCHRFWVALTAFDTAVARNHTTAAPAVAAFISAYGRVDKRGALWVHNASAGVWRKFEAAGSVPQPRSYHVAAAIAGKLYVFGGCGADGRLNELHAYDPASNEWQQLPASDAVPVRPTGES